MMEHSVFEAFKAALDKDPSLEVEVFLDAYPDASPALREQLEDHLFVVGNLRRMGTNYRETPRSQLTAPHSQYPDTIGPYRILRQIGEGGMGTVYLAEQTNPIHRKCALKVIRMGLDSKEVLKRFEDERQALARLEHTNIARLYDAGTSETGQPYFAMEYIEGRPVTQYCVEENLTLRERIELFQGLCRGVQHAHQKGILHRDLKPSNVLIDEGSESPTPKVIDFGLAKAFGTAAEATLYTKAGKMLGTPEYMSPEQAHSDPHAIDSRTDVYSLGVILYELLTGQLPLTADRSRPDWPQEMQRILETKDPDRPSTRTRRISKGSTGHAPGAPHGLGLGINPLRGDLDAITLKALEKEPDHRYAWPQDLADDLQRHLDSRPILARPPGVLRRTLKFARRNLVASILVTSTTFATMAFLTALVVSSYYQTKESAGREQLLRSGLSSLSAGNLDAARGFFETLLETDMNRGTSLSLQGRKALLANIALLYRCGMPAKATRLLLEAGPDLDNLQDEGLASILPGYAFLVDALEGDPLEKPPWLELYCQQADPTGYEAANKLIQRLLPIRRLQIPRLRENPEPIHLLKPGNGERLLAFVGKREGRGSEAEDHSGLYVLSLEGNRISSIDCNAGEILLVHFPRTKRKNQLVPVLAVYRPSSEKTLALGSFGLDLASQRLELHSSTPYLLTGRETEGLDSRPKLIRSWTCRKPEGKQELGIIIVSDAHLRYLTLMDDRWGTPASNLSSIQGDCPIDLAFLGNITADSAPELFLTIGEWDQLSLYLLGVPQAGGEFPTLARQVIGKAEVGAIAKTRSEESYQDILLVKSDDLNTYYEMMNIFGRFRQTGITNATRLLRYHPRTREMRSFQTHPTGMSVGFFSSPRSALISDLDGEGPPEYSLLVHSSPLRQSQKASPPTSESTLQVMVMTPDSSQSRFQTILCCTLSEGGLFSEDLDGDGDEELIHFEEHDSSLGAASTTLTIFGLPKKNKY